MIVVDTNVLAYLYLPGPMTAHAEALLARDPEWVAPKLWRSEFRNILANYLRAKALDLANAYRMQQAAETLMNGRDFDVASRSVLRLCAESGCSAYDCEFIGLAEELGIRLVSSDKKLCKAFPDVATPLSRA